jgi:hypothetical protein
MNGRLQFLAATHEPANNLAGFYDVKAHTPSKGVGDSGSGVHRRRICEREMNACPLMFGVARRNKHAC